MKNLRIMTDAEHRLVVEHLALAMNMGKRYAGLGRFRGVAVEDLQQEACVGLCIAAQRYGEQQGASFQTYAYNWCRKFILQALNGRSVELMADLDCEEPLVETEDAPDLDLEPLLGLLNRQEREVVCQIYGISCEQRDFRAIADRMHVRSPRVHQIYERAMAKMEFQFTAKQLTINN